MKIEDVQIVRKMIKYCEDVAYLMDEYQQSFDLYKEEIAFQYA